MVKAGQFLSKFHEKEGLTKMDLEYIMNETMQRKWRN